VVAAYYQGEPVMFSTVDGQHAMAVYAPSGSPNGGYGVHMFGSVSKWNCVYVEPGPVVYGPYSYNCNVIFGTVNEVLNTLRGLTVGLSNTLVPVFRFLRTNKMDHFLTTDFSGTANHFIPGWQGQKKSLYNFEQTAFGVYDTAIDEGMIPLYLCYQVAAIDHFVSLYSDCEGQAYEGVLGYVSSTPRTGYVPIYRFYRTSVADHLTTTDYSEGPPNGYTFEYILGYAPTYN